METSRQNTFIRTEVLISISEEDYLMINNLLVEQNKALINGVEAYVKAWEPINIWSEIFFDSVMKAKNHNIDDLFNWCVETTDSNHLYFENDEVEVQATINYLLGLNDCTFCRYIIISKKYDLRLRNTLLFDK